VPIGISITRITHIPGWQSRRSDCGDDHR